VTAAERTVAAMRVVAGGILASVVATAGIAVYVRDTLLRPSPSPGLVDALLLGTVLVAGASVAGHAVVRRQVMAELRGRAPELRGTSDPASAAAPAYQRLTIVRAALTESPALFAVVAYLAGGPGWVLAVPAVAAGLLVVAMPSRAALERLVEEALQA